MKRIPLTAKPRTAAGNGPNRRLRQEGNIPAVIYGLGKTPEPVTVNLHDFQQAVAEVGRDLFMFNLETEGAKDRELTVLREVQRDPVSEKIVHMDLLRIDMKKPLDVSVGVIGKGVPAGVKEGGVLDQVLREVSLRCLPDNVPPTIEVDISHLDVGDGIHVSDLQFDDTIEVMSDPDDVIFHVVVPMMTDEVEEEGEGEEIEMAEPEVIGEKKDEGEEDEKKEE